MKEIKWAEDGKGLQIGDKTFAFNTREVAKLAAFVSALDEMTEIHQALTTAKAAFMEGRADYAGAVEKLQVLLGQLSICRTKLAELAMRFESFFDPPGAIQYLEGNLDERSKFVNDAIERMLTINGG